jgi:ABC-2 type transport system ATP-binding protein
MSGDGPIIEVDDVEKSFGTTKALGGVDLTAEAGQVLALLGPNGAGKTTLVRILSTLERPDAGRARVAGYDTVRDAAALRRVVGLTGQFAALDDFLTGRENLEMLGELYHLSRRDARIRAQDVLNEFGLSAAADRQAGTYSGGMRRRLDVAASLIGRPPILILDEPTTGLDAAARIDLWASIEALVAGGTTVLLTTQYLEEADRLAHRIVVIDQGKVIATGTADQLKDQLGGDVIELRVTNGADTARVADVLAPLSGGATIVDHSRQRITVPAPDGPATLAAALDLVRQAGVVIDDIGIRRPSLDEVFLALTGHTTAFSEGDTGSGTSNTAAHSNSGRTR